MISRCNGCFKQITKVKLDKLNQVQDPTISNFLKMPRSTLTKRTKIILCSVEMETRQPRPNSNHFGVSLDPFSAAQEISGQVKALKKLVQLKAVEPAFKLSSIVVTK